MPLNNSNDKKNNMIAQDLFQLDLPVQIYTSYRKQKAYDIYLMENIIDARYYGEALHVLNTAREEDQIKIHLSNEGGLVSTGINLINAIGTCKAELLVDVESPLYSMATLIALAARRRGCTLRIFPNVFFHFHEMSSGMIGKHSEMHDEILFMDVWYKEFFTNLVKDFLFPAEIKQVLSGKELYVPYNTTVVNEKIVKGIIERLKGKKK